MTRFSAKGIYFKAWVDGGGGGCYSPLFPASIYYSYDLILCMQVEVVVVASSGIGVFAMGELVQVINMMMMRRAKAMAKILNIAAQSFRLNMLREYCRARYISVNISGVILQGCCRLKSKYHRGKYWSALIAELIFQGCLRRAEK